MTFKRLELESAVNTQIDSAMKQRLALFARGGNNERLRTTNRMSEALLVVYLVSRPTPSSIL